MATTTRYTVKLKGDPIVEDIAAAGTITPGMLLVLGSGGTVTYHATAGGWSTTWIALERDEIGNDLDDDYTTGQSVKVGKFKTGEEFYGLLAINQTVTLADKLESAGNGMLRKVISDSSAGTIVIGSQRFLARESVTTTSTASRIRVEVA